MIPPRILPDDISALDAGRLAREQRCGLFVTREGKFVIAQHAHAGWQRAGMGLDPARRKPCAS